MRGLVDELHHAEPSSADRALRLHFNENTAGCSPAVLAALRSIDARRTRRSIPTTRRSPRSASGTSASRRLGAAHQRPRRGLHVVAQAAARRRASTASPRVDRRAGVRDVRRLRRSASGCATVHIAPEPDFAFPLERSSRRSRRETRVDLSDRSEQPDRPPRFRRARSSDRRGGAAGARARRRGLRGVQRPHVHRRRRSIVIATSSSAGRSRRRTAWRRCASARSSRIPTRWRRFAGCCRRTASTSRPCARSRPRSTTAAYLDVVRRRIRRVARGCIYDFCRAHGFTYWPSEANFVLMRVGDRRRGASSTRSRQRGILVRDKSARPGCAGCIRITAGVVEHTRAVPRRAGGHPCVARELIDRRRKRRFALRLNLDGRGTYAVRTGIRFLDHMLELVARHGGFDLDDRRRRRSRRRRASHGRGRRHRARRSRARRRSAPSAASTAPATS